MDKIWTRAEFEEKLREKGKGYHIYHPFHVMMYEGKLTKEQLQCWVLNRFYYQIGIPQKDAAILSNCPDKEVRKQWIVRITDHDGVDGAEGGIEDLSLCFLKTQAAEGSQMGPACTLPAALLWEI